MKGVNVIGYFQRSLGQGESARLMVKSLEANGIPYTLYSVDHLAANHHHESISAPLSQQMVYPVNLFCIDADHIAHIVEQLPWNEIKQKHNIGLWFWEANLIPDHKKQCWKHLDEIWVASAYNQEHLSVATKLPVHRIAHPIQLNYTPSPASKANFGLAEKYTFLFCFDFYSSIIRKNPLAIVSAFKKAFQGQENVQLVIKSHNGRMFQSQLDEALRQVGNDNRIIWMDKSMDSHQRFDLMNACDCYISLHRSEGFGLTMAEAFALSKPVITTGYSGNMDFTTLDNSYLCSYQLVRVGEGNRPYPPESIWADAEIDSAAHWMKHVFDNQDEAKKKALLGKALIENEHSCQKVGMQIKKRLEALPATIPERKKHLSYHLVTVKKVYKAIRKELRPVKRAAKALVAKLKGT